MNRRALFSRRQAVLLSLLLFFLFAGALLAGGAFLARPGVHVRSMADGERLMTGRDDPDHPPSELLPGELVDINRDGAERLQLLPGIGEVLAGEIIAYRLENGPFTSPEQLMEVPGIGQGRYDALSGLITIGGG